jgi:hypothetical protein
MVIGRNRQALHELQERITVLEEELLEQRQLSRRLTELTDLVAELLMPLAARDEQAAESLQRYRDQL